MGAYSKLIADDGSAAIALKKMEPKPRMAVEDPNAMAEFLEDMGKKAHTDEEEGMDFKPKQNDELTMTKEQSGEQEGAEFAAMFAQDIESNQKEKEYLKNAGLDK